VNPLRVGEAQPSGTDLFPKYAMLFLAIVDDVALLLVYLTGERDENASQRKQVSRLPEAGFVGCLGPARSEIHNLYQRSARLRRRSGFGQ
jgi:hypothetical protein